MDDIEILVPIVVAAITAAGSLAALSVNAWLSGNRERTNRRRDVFSKAFAASVAYEEFPYVVRRRRNSAPEEERIRISSELRMVQEDVSYYQAWLSTEAQSVSDAYEALIGKLREIVGREISRAWSEPPVNSDEEMNMPDLGFGELKPFKLDYLREVTNQLRPVPSWLRRPRKSK